MSQTSTNGSKGEQSPPRLSPSDLGLRRALYSVGETLELLSIGRTTFYREVKAGRIKLVKLGCKSVVRVDDLVGLLEGLRADAA